MSKNLTRKGLALGAIVALGSSLFAGTPALAAGEQLTVAANSVGKELFAPADQTFSLKAFYNSGFSSANAAQIKFKVSSNAEYQVVATPGTGSALTLAAGTTSGVVADTTAGAIKTLVLDPSTTSAQSTVVTVQAFEDQDGGGTIDTGEWISAPVQVNFIKRSDVTFTPVIDVVRPGDQAITAKITSNINLSQLALGSGADATTNGTQVVASFSSTVADNSAPIDTFAVADAAVVRTTYDADNNRLTATSSSVTGFVAGDSAKVNVWFFGAKDSLADATTAIINTTGTLLAPAGTGDNVIKATSTFAVAPVTVSSVGAATVTASATASQTGTAATVIQTAGSFVVSSTVVASAGASAAGQTVTFTISEASANSLAAGGTITSGTVVLSNTNAGGAVQTKDVTAVTDADGKASITVTYAGLTNTDSLTNSFTITPKAQGVLGTGVTVTAASQTIGTIANTNVIGAGAQLVVAKDAAIDLTFGVVDVFGKPVTGAGYSVSVTQGSTTVVGSVVNGLATVTFPAYTTTGDRTLVAQGKKNGVDAGSPVNVLVTVGADTVANTLTYAGSIADHGVATAIALNTEAAFVAADTRKGEVAAKTTAAALTTISGNVYTATGAGALTTVTLSGKGLDFVASGVYAKDSITVRTSATGSYSVEVRSSLSGTRTLTITSGAVVRTQNLIFATVSDQAGKTLTITGADKVSAGRSLRFSGKLVDKLGQPVTVTSSATRTFTVSYDGPGFVTSMPTSTDVNGNFFVNVLLGAGDTGLATLTATYDGDAAGATYSTISAAKSVLVGVSAKITKASTSSAVIKNASGLTVKIVRGSKSTTKVATSDSFKVSLKGGTGTVKVYVNGVKVASK